MILTNLLSLATQVMFYAYPCRSYHCQPSLTASTNPAIAYIGNDFHYLISIMEDGKVYGMKLLLQADRENQLGSHRNCRGRRFHINPSSARNTRLRLTNLLKT